MEPQSGSGIRRGGLWPQALGSREARSEHLRHHASPASSGLFPGGGVSRKGWVARVLPSPVGGREEAGGQPA